jgi:hypothetical protein
MFNFIECGFVWHNHLLWWLLHSPALGFPNYVLWLRRTFDLGFRPHDRSVSLPALNHHIGK